MTANPITVSPQSSMQEAMELMARKHIRHLPVVDATGSMIGLLTDRDLRRAAPSPLFNTSSENVQEVLSATPVEKIMVRSPATVEATHSLREAVQLMVEKKYGALPVVNGARLVGILSQIDVLRWWVKSQM
jgi:acetoin utilization protein AcuB